MRQLSYFMLLMLVTYVGATENERILAGSDEDHGIEFLFIFIVFGLLIGMFLYWIKHLTSIPYTPMLLIVGIIFGYFHRSLGFFGESIDYVIHISAHTLLLVFIPPLIFESAFNADIFIFIKSKYQILMLALPGVAITSVLIAITLMYILGYRKDDASPDTTVFNWAESLTVGAILAATDPVAVVALLKELGTSIRFNMLLEGESLFNDGTATVFFWVFMAYIKDGVFNFGDFIVTFIRLSLGGPLLGLAIGMISLPILKRVTHYHKILVVMTFFVAYLTFFLSESTFFGIRVSGILALVILGLYLKAKLRARLDSHAEENVEIVWHFSAFILETLLFLLTGLYLGEFFQNNDPNGFVISWGDFGKLIAFNILLIMIRGIVNCILWPVLNIIGYTITWKDIIVMTYGGLRGAIGLALALFIATSNEPSIINTFKGLSVFYVAGTITFTVLVNGLTIKYLMMAINFIKKSSIQEKMKIMVKEVLLMESFNNIEDIKTYSWLSKTNWIIVEDILNLNRKTKEITAAAITFQTVGMENKIKKLNQIIYGLEELIRYKKNRGSIRIKSSKKVIAREFPGSKKNHIDSRLEGIKEEDSINRENTENKKTDELDKNHDSEMEQFVKEESQSNLEFSMDPNFISSKKLKPNDLPKSLKKSNFHPSDKGVLDEGHIQSIGKKETVSDIKKSKQVIGSKQDFKRSSLSESGDLFRVGMRRQGVNNFVRRNSTLMDLKDINTENDPNEIMKELRFKIYKMIIANVFEKYESYLCTYKTFKFTKKICELASEKNHQRFSIFKYYKRYYLDMVWFKGYQFLGKAPSFIGKLFRRKIFTRYFYSYDILSTLSLVLNDIKKDKDNIVFKLFEKEKVKMMSEIDEEIQKIKNKILELPDEYSSAVQTRKAVNILLNRERELVQKLVHKGIISSKLEEEFRNERSKCREKIKQLENHKIEELNNVGDYCHLRFLFPILFDLENEDVNLIKNGLKEVTYEPQDILYGTSDEPHNVFMLVSGIVNMRRQDGKIAKTHIERDLIGLESVLSDQDTHRAQAVVIERSVVYEVDVDIMRTIANKVPEFKKQCVIESSYYMIKTTTKLENEGKTDFYKRLVKVKGAMLFEILKGSKHQVLADRDQEIVTSSAIFVFKGKIKYKFLNAKGDGNFYELDTDDALSIGKKIIVSMEPDTYFLELDVSNCFKKDDDTMTHKSE